MTTTKIMPLGDSITDGYLLGVAASDVEGYRLPLERLLAAGGYDYTYVGSVEHGTSALRDWTGEGHNGYSAKTVNDTYITGWLTTYTPDVILMILGTNDLAEYDGALNGISGPTTAARLTTLLATIYSLRPATKVLMGSPPYMSSRLFEWTRLIPLLPGVVATAKLAGQDVRLVDMSSVAVADVAGHPTLAGFSTMADLWYAALVQLLPAPAVAYREQRLGLWGAG